MVVCKVFLREYFLIIIKQFVLRCADITLILSVCTVNQRVRIRKFIPICRKSVLPSASVPVFLNAFGVNARNRYISVFNVILAFCGINKLYRSNISIPDTSAKNGFASTNAHLNSTSHSSSFSYVT